MANIEKIPRLRKENRKKRTNRQLLVLMMLFFLVLLVVLFFQSSISRVQDISVTGTQLVSADEVIKQSHLTFDMQYLLVNKEKVKNSIVTALPAIESVDVRKTFPGKIELAVKERPRVALFMDGQGALYPVTNKGGILKQYPIGDGTVDKPIIRRWQTENLLPKFAAELDKLDPGIRQQISEIQHESDKNNPERLILFMKDGFEVHTTIQNFADNMAWYPSFVQSLKQEGKTEGIINLSEVKWFAPYKQQQPANNEK
ncbi:MULTISPECIES: cell division protein FtsQ/DivIB [Aneurinibacillus]|jgi:cell division protein FtsQ|uniref:Cell division protein DivIB n=1 Tax=Aneurinibacillus danicus TaxID=267746 RepID=A0A511V1G8_9BACL|nr:MULTISPECIES: FtsQ-type POTRA domain-containing protein [Aneurinibacillus]GEN32735.1 cell division protein DivIB [Aneurinibacillus danicus]